MIHPHTEIKFISPVKGYGVVATQFIPKGTITWVHDTLDRTFTPNEVASMPDLFRQIIETYTFRDNQGRFVLCWDNARFVNHSFNSNCLSTAYDFEIAIRDIHPGEELTDDYGYLNITEPFDAVREPGSERTTVYPDDLLRYHQQWDKTLLNTWPHLKDVPQPLAELLPSHNWKTALDIAHGKIAMKSILTCYYPDENNSKNGHLHKNAPFENPIKP